jgi:hypothetical protein
MPILSENTELLWEALQNAQSKFEEPAKSGSNSHLKNRYSTLKDIQDAIRKSLFSNGLMILQEPEFHDGQLMVCTICAHKSGQRMMFYSPIHPIKMDPQGIGSAITYAKRYALIGFLGVGGDDASDDDGVAASTPPAKKANKWGQGPITIQPLAKMMEGKSIPLHYLGDYVESLAQKHGKPVESIIESAMIPEFFDKFTVGYAKEVAKMTDRPS